VPAPEVGSPVLAPAPGPEVPNTSVKVSYQLSGVSAEDFAKKEAEYNHVIAQVTLLEDTCQVRSTTSWENCEIWRSLNVSQICCCCLVCIPQKGQYNYGIVQVIAPVIKESRSF